MMASFIRRTALLLGLALPSLLAEAEEPKQKSPALPVKLGKIPDVRLVPRPAVSATEAKRIKALIAGLAALDKPDFGLSATLSGSAFAPLPGQSRASTMLLTDHKLRPAEGLKALVTLGPDALPFLLDALDDKTPTKITIEHGGSFAGIHGSGGDPRWFWDWYVDTLIGARFIGHPGKPQFQTATVRLVDRRSTIGSGVAEHWPLLEEWYSFDRNPVDGGAVAVATIDEQDYKQIGYRGENLAMGYHPIAWRKAVGDGRMFYSAIGHRPENYDEPQAAALLANGIAWAMRNQATGPKGSKAHD